MMSILQSHPYMAFMKEFIDPPIGNMGMQDMEGVKRVIIISYTALRIHNLPL